MIVYRVSDLRSSAITAEQNKGFGLAYEAMEKFETAVADVALQSSLRESTLGEMDAHMAKIKRRRGLEVPFRAI